jgi:hypothetical protein
MSEEWSISIFVCKVILVKMHCQLVEVYGLCVSCRCGAVLLTTAGWMLISSDLDSQACPLHLMLRVMQMLLLERTDALKWMTWLRNEAFGWVVCTVSSTTNRITDSCVLAVCWSTSHFQSSSYVSRLCVWHVTLFKHSIKVRIQFSAWEYLLRYLLKCLSTY